MGALRYNLAATLKPTIASVPPVVLFPCDLGAAWPTVLREELALLAVAQCVAAIAFPCTLQLHFLGDLVKLLLFHLHTSCADQGLSASRFVILQLLAVEMLSSEISTAVARACV